MFPPLFNPDGPNVTGLPAAPLLIVIPPLFNVVSPAFILPAAPKSTLSLISYTTFPLTSTEATVFLPLLKSNPFANVVVWSFVPLALYVKFVPAAIELVSTFKS